MTEKQKQVKAILENHGYGAFFDDGGELTITQPNRQGAPHVIVSLDTYFGKLVLHTVSSNWGLGEGDALREDLDQCLKIMDAVSEIAPEMVFM